MNNMPADKNRRVLIIDDNRAIHDDFRKILSPAPATAAALDATETAMFGPPTETVQETQFEVDPAYQGQEGVLLVKKALEAGRPYAMAFVDVRMPPGMDGVETTRKIWELDPNVQIVLCTAYSDHSWDEIFAKLGHRDGLLILKKPFDAVEAFQLAHALTEKWWLHMQSRRKMEELESLVAGRTSELQQSNHALQAEVVERKQAEEALRQAHNELEKRVAERTAELSQERRLLRTLINNLPDCIYAKDAAGRKTMANAADLKNLRCRTEAEAIGKSDFDVFPPDIAEKFWADDQKVIQGEPVINREELSVNDEGEKYWQLTSKLPLRDQDGKVVGLVGIGRNITERKQAEEALRQSRDELEKRVTERTAELSQERRLLRTLIDNLPDGIYAKDAAGRKTMANLADLKVMGCRTEAEAIGKSDFDLFPKDIAEKFCADDQKVIHGEPVINREEYFLNDEGEKRWLLTSKLPLRDQHGAIVGLIGIGHDITERKKAEAALQENQRQLAETNQMLQMVMDTIPVRLFWKNKDSVYMGCNQLFAEGAGRKSSEEIVGETDYNLGWREQAELYRKDDMEVMRSGNSTLGYEEPQTAPDGKQIWLRTSKVPLRDINNRVVGILGTYEDITARKRAEELLHYEQTLVATLMDNLPDAVYFKDTASRFLRANRALSRKFSLSDPAQLVGKSDADFFSEEHAGRALADEQKIIHTGQPLLNVEEKETWLDGTVGWVVTSKLPLRDTAGRIVGTCGISRDITERKRSEEALQNSRALYFSLVENMPQSVFRKDRAGRFEFVNKRFCQGLKRSPEDIVGRTDADFFPPELAQAYRKDDLQVMETGQVLDQEERHVGADGRELHVHVIKTPLRDAQGQVIGIQGVFWDITARKRAEEMLRINQERLLKVITQTRCILSFGQVEGLEGWRKRALHPESPFRWDFQVQNEEAAQKILPLELAPGEQYQQALARSRSHDDHTQMNWNSGNAFLNDLPFYRNEFRCTDKNGVGHWMQQLVTVQKLAENRWEIFGITTDISDLKRVETELRESQALYHSLVEQMPAGIFRKDTKGRYVFVNSTFCRLKEMSPDQFLGKTALEIELKDVALATKGAGHHATIMQSGKPIEDDELYFSAAGETRYYHAVKSPVFDFAGQIMGTQGVLFDVTERKRAEEALREAGERFQLVARATNDAVWDWNLTSPAWWNDTFYEIYGFDRNSTPSFEAWASHIHPDDQERVMAGFRAVVEHGEPAWSDEFRFKRADGTYGHVFDRAYSLRDASGKTVRMLGSMMDITERKRAEMALRESEAELRVILESTADGILAVDSKGEKVIKANRQFAELWRIPQSLMDAGNNRVLLDFVREQLSEPDTFFKKVQSLYGTNAVATDTLVFKDGRVFEFYTYPMIMDGVVIGRVWSFRNITARKRQEKELSEKSSELERFTYTVSHDLKSPLVTVKTFLGYLEQDMTRPDKERVKQDVAYMHTAADKMGQLLDELLNLARVGRKSNPDERITFKELAQEAVRLVAGRISTGGAEVQVADAAVVLEGDRPRLIEIWQNLVENACKFMGNQPKPRVEIGVEQRGSETVFFVHDNGAGIDPRFQEKVFGLFEKLDPKGEGTGMGLALVKRIVEMYKGRIWVESPGLGQGANFLFTLPGAVIIDPEQSS